MSAHPPLRGVIVDMDGLLIDSEPVYREASRRAAKRQGHDLTDENYNTLIGRPAHSVHERLQAMLGPYFDLDRYQTAFHEEWQTLSRSGAIQPKPGAHSFLTALAEVGLPCTLATSTFRERMLQSLAATELADFIEHAVCGDEVVNGKPAPDIVHAAAARIDCEAAACVVLEDSNVGVAAALAAGARVVMVPDLDLPSADTLAAAITILEDLYEAREHVLGMLAHGPDADDGKGDHNHDHHH